MVPPDVPAVPLQRDLSAEQARLKLRPEPEASALKLDLRKEMHLERSRLLNRLTLLDIPWGTTVKARGLQTGTYTEVWQLQWTPGLSLRVIEAAAWGNTVRDAAAACATDAAAGRAELPELTEMIDQIIMADLPEVLPAILARIEELSTMKRDVPHMLAALPPLADVVRYGSLRQTADHLPLLRRVFDRLLTRACLGLPGAATAIDEGAAADLTERLSAAATAVRLFQAEEATGRWQQALGRLADRDGIHPNVAGRATRLLLDEAALRPDGALARLERALTPGGSVEVARYAADWLDGFLRDSGLLLLHDRALWGAIDGWLTALDPERFQAILPLLRRTFAAYPEGVRQQLQDRLREAGGRGATAAIQMPTFDPRRAAGVLPALGRILGLPAAAEVTT